MKTERQMFESSFQRPRDFFALSAQSQWTIDKSLGILDWEGRDLTEADHQRFQSHYGLGG